MRDIPVRIWAVLIVVGLYCDGLMRRGRPEAKTTMSLPVIFRQGVLIYNVSAVSVAKPTNQTAGSVLHEMSIVVKNSDLTQNVSDSIIHCLADRTNTPPTDWGLYNHSRFSNTLIQAEYYGYCKREVVSTFQTNVTQYISDKELVVCVKNKAPAEFVSAVESDTPDILYARQIIESLPNGTHHEGGIAAWVVGVVVASILLVAIILSIVIMIKRKRIYETVAYDPEADFTQEKELSDGEKERDEFEKHLKAITVGYD